ncbi:MAG: DNA repair protein RecN [Alphaproteobacteria bacterium]|nr:DNA repair protein RecN [Alphaproteobacteria bacterium]
MLTRLAINDVVLIDKLALDLRPGLCAFTGETGAGKSILLDALGLALGRRSDAAFVRQGCAQAAVTAAFDLPRAHAANGLLEEQGLPVEDELLLRRVVGQDGKSRAFVNDQPASIAFLRLLGEYLVEIHGQFETHGLLDPATHRVLLDAFGKCAAQAAKVAQTFGVWRDALDAHEQAAADIQRAREEEAFLRAAVTELDRLAPQQGEAEILTARRTRLQNAEKITEALQHAAQALESEQGAEARLNEASRSIARITDKAGEPAAALLATLDRAGNELAEALQQLERLMRDADLDPDTLNEVEERLFALRACARKHNAPVDDLGRVRDDLAARLERLEHDGDILAALAKKAAAARHAFEQEARTLSRQRSKAARELQELVAAELSPLKLERAKLYVELQELPEAQWNAGGTDKILFLASTNPGTAPGPLHKIASGGELARFMLALKVVLAEADPIPTLVFDEVDTGIGGATATAVGERLARLARQVQVLVVTHSPQVAAKAGAHYRVSKAVRGGAAFTAVTLLDDDKRREEIARMLAGAAVTDAARAAADSLIGGDASPRKRARN